MNSGKCSSASKRIRVFHKDASCSPQGSSNCEAAAQTNTSKNVKNPLINDPYFSLICSFLTSIEIVSIIGLLTKWNYYYFKPSNMNNIKYSSINNGKKIVNNTLCNEFGDKMYFDKHPNINRTTLEMLDNYSKIQILYNRKATIPTLGYTFWYRGFVALKYFILKLDDNDTLATGSMVNTFWRLVTSFVHISEIQQVDTDPIEMKARIVFPENIKMTDHDDDDDEKNVYGIYYCRCKQNEFGTMRINDSEMDIVDKDHLCLIKKILNESQLAARLFSHDSCQSYLQIIQKIIQIFHCSRHYGVLPKPPNKKMKRAMKIAVLYDQFLIDDFIFPFFKCRLDYQSNLLMQNDTQSSNTIAMQNKYTNILDMAEICVTMQKNVKEMIEKMDHFIENYQNKTFKGGYDWAFISVDQQIKKLQTVKQNLVELNFDNINNLFRNWFLKSSKVWNKLYTENDQVKLDVDNTLAKLQEISDDVVKKMFPTEWPVHV